MITTVIIKEALCFYKFKPSLSDDNRITENENMATDDRSGSYVSNI